MQPARTETILSMPTASPHVEAAGARICFRACGTLRKWLTAAQKQLILRRRVKNVASAVAAAWLCGSLAAGAERLFPRAPAADAAAPASPSNEARQEALPASGGSATRPAMAPSTRFAGKDRADELPSVMKVSSRHEEVASGKKWSSQPASNPRPPAASTTARKRGADGTQRLASSPSLGGKTRLRVLPVQEPLPLSEPPPPDDATAPNATAPDATASDPAAGASAPGVAPLPDDSEIASRPLSAINLDIRERSNYLPTDYAAAKFGKIAEAAPLWSGQQREWMPYNYYWQASAFCHQPLYFEEVNLERYGYSACPALQPLLSGAHFFATIPTLPYQVAMDHPRECVYTLGHYRPGSPAPWERHRFRADPEAALFQAGAVVGLIFLIP